MGRSSFAKKNAPSPSTRQRIRNAPSRCEWCARHPGMRCTEFIQAESLHISSHTNAPLELGESDVASCPDPIPPPTPHRHPYRKVLELGGLSVVGTARHESRRVDNQLRGRAGRQGDPGATRFFLSLDDDIFRYT